MALLEDINWAGLSNEEAIAKQTMYGKNKIPTKNKETFFSKVFSIVSEPMFLLLIGASIVYFILGEPIDGSIMLFFVCVIVTIEIIQSWKTDATLKALKDLSAPHIKVIRNKKTLKILSEDLVAGDLMLIEEGSKIPADGYVVKANDLRVNESSLTGESIAVWKHIVKNDTVIQESESGWREDYCYTGTLVTNGSGTILVDKSGEDTEYGKIGHQLTQLIPNQSPLEKQTNKLVVICTIIAIFLFLLVAIFTFFDFSELPLRTRLIQSILSGITLAMAMIPEEFPVVLTIFLSMGAWRLAKKNALVKSMPAVETMGAISVLCVDKTGTITKNQMIVSEIIPFSEQKFNLIEIMGLACETEPYDPMEIAILNYCNTHEYLDKDLFNGQLITEYSFTDELKTMGHVWKKNSQIILAAKGAPESILPISILTQEERSEIEKKIIDLSNQGLRVIAVGYSIFSDKQTIPDSINDCRINFCGLVALIDPPREGIQNNIKECHDAGIRVVMITGDNGLTAEAIARQVGIEKTQKIFTGNELNRLSEEELQAVVKSTDVFSRVTPEQKMRIIKALKETGDVVAMTGDGVNDAPALKLADIGIAMGENGSEVSREAADLVLLDDNFHTIVTTIQDGRRIYDNIKKAIGYILVIHIPIALIALACPFLRIPHESLFLLPIHVVLLELVIDPTCSVVLERIPCEPDIMKKSPRQADEFIITRSLLLKSLLQGFVIFLASFGSYYYTLLNNPQNDELARSIGLVILIFANAFLVIVNSSKTEMAIKTVYSTRKDKVLWSILGATIGILLLLIYSPFSQILDLAPLSFLQLVIAILIAFLSVGWYDIVKMFKHPKSLKKNPLAFFFHI